MSCTIYATRPVSFATLALSALLATLAGVIRHGDRWVTAGVFCGAVLLIAAVILILRKPVIRVDGRGVVYLPRRIPAIPWADLDGVKRAPLIEPTSDGLLNHVEDGSRPVLLVLRPADQRTRQLPREWQPLLVRDSQTDRVCLRIEFTGLAPASVKVHDCIQHHLEFVGAGA